MFNPTFRLVAKISVLASLSACSSDGNNDATGGSSGNTGGSSSTGGNSSTGGKSGTLQGTFTAEFVAADVGTSSPAYTKFLGVVYDGPSPPTIVLKLDSEQAGCQLLVPKNPFCSPSCGAAGVCTDENQCTPYPTSQSVGTVRVTGLGPSEVVMMPGPSLAYQPDVTLPNPACDEGDAVSVQADGISIQGKCIAPFTLMTPEPIPVQTGKPVALTWAAAGQPSLARVKIKLDIAHHGGKKGEIVCDVADSGSFSIPEPLVTKLVSLGLAGYPTIGVGRVATATASAQSGVKLQIASSVERAVDTGVISCTTDSECPTGKTCADDLSCK
jgi:hypothetical protein